MDVCRTSAVELRFLEALQITKPVDIKQVELEYGKRFKLLESSEERLVLSATFETVIQKTLEQQQLNKRYQRVMKYAHDDGLESPFLSVVDPCAQWLPGRNVPSVLRVATISRGSSLIPTLVRDGTTKERIQNAVQEMIAYANRRMKVQLAIANAEQFELASEQHLFETAYAARRTTLEAAGYSEQSILELDEKVAKRRNSMSEGDQKEEDVPEPKLVNAMESLTNLHNQMKRPVLDTIRSPKFLTNLHNQITLDIIESSTPSNEDDCKNDGFWVENDDYVEKNSDFEVNIMGEEKPSQRTSLRTYKNPNFDQRGRINRHSDVVLEEIEENNMHHREAAMDLLALEDDEDLSTHPQAVVAIAEEEAGVVDDITNRILDKLFIGIFDEPEVHSKLVERLDLIRRKHSEGQLIPAGATHVPPASDDDDDGFDELETNILSPLRRLQGCCTPHPIARRGTGLETTESDDGDEKTISPHDGDDDDADLNGICDFQERRDVERKFSTPTPFEDVE